MSREQRSAQFRGKMRLLLIEDNTPLADATARGLRREGFDVDVAGDGSTAIDKLTYIDYDLVVLDRNLPDVPGDDQIVEAAVLDAHGGSIEWNRADGHVVARATLPGDLSQPRGGGRHVGMVSSPPEGSGGDRRSEVVA